MVTPADNVCQINARETVASQKGIEWYRYRIATVRALTLF
jgi:hypothetical protein